MKSPTEHINIGNNIKLGVKKINKNQPHKPLLLFLHEGLGSIEQWKDFPENLCDAVNLDGIVFDRYGYGTSSPLKEKRPTNYLNIEGEKNLPLLINQLNLNQSVILIGHSDGGSIALVYASTQPKNLIGCITIAAHVFVEQISVDGIKAFTKMYEENVKLQNALKKYHGEKINSIFYGWSDTWQTAEFKKWNIEALLKKINCPVLALQGKDDEYGTEKQVKSICENVNGHCKYVMIENAAHSPHQDKPEEVLEEIKQFISNIVTFATQ